MKLAPLALGVALGVASLSSCATPSDPAYPGVSATSSALAAPVAAPLRAPAPASRVVHVASVHDGDTFTDSAGVKYRVLVEDSCELGTPGGTRAQTQARQLLNGKDVTVSPIGKRSYDRELAYVTLPDGRDFADVMLEADHTAVYAGRNDASAGKVAEGRTHDANGRTCGTAVKATTTTKAKPAIAKTKAAARTPEPGDADYVSANDPLAAQRDPWVSGQVAWTDCIATKTTAQCRKELN